MEEGSSPNGHVYHCPFSTLFPRHTQAERDWMVESLRKNGLNVKLVLYRDPDIDGICLLDGDGRMEAANRLGEFQLEIQDLGNMTRSEAYEQAIVYNDDRRQDDPENVKKRKEERLQRVAELRSEGKSIRDIAALDQ